MIDRSKDIKRVLITGVAGSCGRYLVDYLKQEHPVVQIHGACRRKHSRNVPGVTLHEVDMLDAFSIETAIVACHPQVIFHLAANPDKGFEIPSAILQNNVIGTVNLFQAATKYKSGWDAEHANNRETIIINVSSSEVYGAVDPAVDVPIKETCPFRPVSPYAISKVAQDHLGRMYCKAYGLKVITTRAFTYLNNHRSDLFTSNFARQIALIEQGKQQVLKHGNLDSVRTLMDARDVVRAYWLAATRCEFGEAYNIGGDVSLTVGEVLSKLYWLSRVTINCEADSSLMRPVDVTLQIPDTTKFREQTGWEPRFKLEESLKALLDYWRNKEK